jgi:hypothetical protein
LEDEGNIPLKELDIYGKMILDDITGKKIVRMLTGYIWLRMNNSAGFFSI